MSIIIKKSVLVEDYSQYHWLEQHGNVKYHDIINYERAGVKGEHHCVMCGLIKGLQCEIPNQNKDVCKICDCSYWRILNGNIIVKFCKGCKKFSMLSEFKDKPEASKCAKCRERGRQNYYSRKQTIPNQKKKTNKDDYNLDNHIPSIDPTQSSNQQNSNNYSYPYQFVIPSIINTSQDSNHSNYSHSNHGSESYISNNGYSNHSNISHNSNQNGFISRESSPELFQQPTRSRSTSNDSQSTDHTYNSLKQDSLPKIQQYHSIITGNNNNNNNINENNSQNSAWEQNLYIARSQQQQRQQQYHPPYSELRINTDTPTISFPSSDRRSSSSSTLFPSPNPLPLDIDSNMMSYTDSEPIYPTTSIESTSDFVSSSLSSLDSQNTSIGSVDMSYMMSTAIATTPAETFYSTLNTSLSSINGMDGIIAPSPQNKYHYQSQSHQNQNSHHLQHSQTPLTKYNLRNHRRDNNNNNNNNNNINNNNQIYSPRNSLPNYPPGYQPNHLSTNHDSNISFLNTPSLPLFASSPSPSSSTIGHLQNGIGSSPTTGNYLDNGMNGVITPLSSLAGSPESDLENLNNSTGDYKWDPHINPLMNLASVSECMLSTNPTNGNTNIIGHNMIGNIGNGNGNLNTLSPIMNPNQRSTRSHIQIQSMPSPTSYLTAIAGTTIAGRGGSPSTNGNSIGSVVAIATVTGSLYKNCISNQFQTSSSSSSLLSLNGTNRSTLTISPPPNDEINDIAPLLTISPVEGMSPKYLTSPLSTDDIENHQQIQKRQCIEQNEDINNLIDVEISNFIGNKIEEINDNNSNDNNNNNNNNSNSNSNNINNSSNNNDNNSTINSSYLNTTTECLSDEKASFQSKNFNHFPSYPQNQLQIVHPQNEKQLEENKICRRKRRRKNGNDNDDDDYIIQVAIVDSTELRSLSPVNVPSMQ